VSAVFPVNIILVLSAFATLGSIPTTPPTSISQNNEINNKGTQQTTQPWYDSWSKRRNVEEPVHRITTRNSNSNQRVITHGGKQMHEGLATDHEH
jgi:hypothetical protein